VKAVRLQWGQAATEWKLREAAHENQVKRLQTALEEEKMESERLRQMNKEETIHKRNVHREEAQKL